MSNSSASSLGGRGSGGVAAAAPSMSASAIVAKAVSGSHVLKIEGYSRTLGLGNGRFITSRSFEIGGHRWYLRYYPDSYYPVDHHCICILLCLDPSEAGPVRAQWKLSLLDKQGHPVAREVSKIQACADFSGKLEPRNSCMFISRTELENDLKDDAFSVRCDINVDLGIVAEDVMTVERRLRSIV